MKKKMLLVPLALLLVMSLVAIGCPAPAPAPTPAPAPAPEPMPGTITVTDSAGREVEVSLPLERVIVINPLAAEIVHAIGAADRIIGVSGPTARDESLPGLYGKEVVSLRGHGEPDFERIIELRPQLVIAWGTHPAVDLVALAETMAPANIPVAGIDAFRLATLFDDIETLGKLFEEEKASARLVEFLQAPLDLIEGKVAALGPDERIRVYAEHHAREFFAFGPGSDWHNMIEKVGGVNIFADAHRPFIDVDPEKVIVRNPQVILKKTLRGAPMGFGATAVEPIREYLQGIARPGWENLEAVKDGRVYLISMDLAFGPLSIVLNLYMGKILHPELFADVDPGSILREYFQEFHGVELKGIFIYPEP